jgi:PiT family inorganic phosphate transporter
MGVLAFLKSLIGGYLGWNIGANAGATVIGPHVGSNLLSYRLLVWILAIFSILGAVISGQEMVTDIGKILPNTAALEQYTGWAMINLAVLVTLSAGIAINIATYLGIPTSVTQGSIGAFFGLSVAVGIQEALLVGPNALPPWDVFGKMFGSWIVSPFLAAGLGFALRRWGQSVVEGILSNERIFRQVLISLLVITAAYGSYMLSATHAGLAVAPFYKAGVFQDWLGIPARTWAAGSGGLAIAIGALTYSRNVVYSVGRKITQLDPFSAVCAILSMSLCLNLFKQIGVPVSSSQAVVGAVTGVGLTKGTQAVSFDTLKKIVIGWIATPVFPAIVTGSIYGGLVYFSIV